MESIAPRITPLCSLVKPALDVVNLSVTSVIDPNLEISDCVPFVKGIFAKAAIALSFAVCKSTEVLLSLSNKIFDFSNCLILISICCCSSVDLPLLEFSNPFICCSLTFVCP